MFKSYLFLIIFFDWDERSDQAFYFAFLHTSPAVSLLMMSTRQRFCAAMEML